MQYRELGRTGWKVSAVSFGAWAIGGIWGDVDDKESLAAALHALDDGVNFFDTADVYGDGRSERLLAQPPPQTKRPSTSPPRPAAGSPRRPSPATAGKTSRPSSNAAFRIWARKPSICCNCIARHRGLLPPRSVRHARRSQKGRQDSPLRRQRRKGRGSSQGHRVSRRAVGADHLQHVPPAPAELFFAQARREGRHPGPAAAVLGHARGQVRRDSTFADGRSPRLQPPRRGLGPRRNIFRPRLRARLAVPSMRCGRWCRRARASAQFGPPLDSHVPRRDLSIPGAKRPTQVRMKTSAPPTCRP